MNEEEKLLGLLVSFNKEMSQEKIANHLLATTYLHYKPNGIFKNVALSLMSDISDEQKENLYIFIEKVADLRQLIDLFYFLKKNYDEYTGSISANSQVNRLVTQLLRLKENDVIIDLCSGGGNFLFDVSKVQIGNIKYSGIEINSAYSLVSQLVFDLLETQFNFINGDALYKEFGEFDKGFVFPPFGLKYDESYQKYLENYQELFSNRTSIEWLFVDRLIRKMKTDGRIVALLVGKPLYSTADEKYRNYLLDNKLLEGIIELPEGALFPNTWIQTTILIISNKNEKVKVIDGKNYSQNSNGIKKLKDFDIDRFALLRDYENNNCTCMTTNEIREKKTFVVANLLAKTIEIKFGKKFSDIAEISQGSQYTVANFKDKITTEKTNFRILTSSEIDDGNIDWNSLANINNSDMKLLKHRLQKNDLVMTSKSSKIKIAVVDFEPKDNIIVTGGMFIIRPNTEIINPTFLKMFLKSKKGIEQLKSIQKGSMIPIIPTNMLKELMISCPPLKEQNKYAASYQAKLDSYVKMKKELDELENTINNYYDNILS